MSAPLEQLAELVRERSGIVLTGQRLDSLAAALAKLAPQLDGAAALRAARDPRDGETFVAALIEAVAVHETFFFRQREDLDAIDWHALLAGARVRGTSQMRVWVAGCSTGEEAYTLALLAIDALGAQPPVALLATDLSAAALRRAQEGRYGPRAVRNLEARHRERHFAPAGAREISVGAELRALVELRQHNLVAEPPPEGPFDLILCRNVLIYFDTATVERVVRTLEGALAPGGMLLLGAADRLCQPRAAAAARARSRPVQAAAAAVRRRSRVQRPAPSRWRTPRPHEPEPAESLDPAPSASMAGGEDALRAALPPQSAPDGDEPLRAALAAADAGRIDEAIAASGRVLESDPLDADARFIAGIAQLGSGDAASAAQELRRALYVDPGFALAAFQLARAYDALGDRSAAARAYRQTLRTLAPGHERQQRLAPDLDLADIAAACGARLAALESCSA